VKIIKEWPGVQIKCLPCGAIFQIDRSDLSNKLIHTRSESMLEALMKDKGGLMWTECPNCNTTVSIAADDIPLFYRKFVVVKRAVAI
jgi:hypothetical protein